MNEILIDAFRHKLWAMQTLIAACQDRSVDELTRPAPGFGSILATLNHLVLADAGYVASLGGGRADWASDDSVFERCPGVCAGMIRMLLYLAINRMVWR